MGAAQKPLGFPQGEEGANYSFRGPKYYVTTKTNSCLLEKGSFQNGPCCRNSRDIGVKVMKNPSCSLVIPYADTNLRSCGAGTHWEVCCMPKM